MFAPFSKEKYKHRTVKRLFSIILLPSARSSSAYWSEFVNNGLRMFCMSWCQTLAGSFPAQTMTHFSAQTLTHTHDSGLLLRLSAASGAGVCRGVALWMLCSLLPSSHWPRAPNRPALPVLRSNCFLFYKARSNRSFVMSKQKQGRACWHNRNFITFVWRRLCRNACLAVSVYAWSTIVFQSVSWRIAISWHIDFCARSLSQPPSILLVPPRGEIEQLLPPLDEL